MKYEGKERKTPVNELVDTAYQEKFLHRFVLLLVALIIGQSGYFIIIDALSLAVFNCLVLLGLWLSLWILKRYSYDLASSLVILLCLSVVLSSILSSGLSNSTIFWFFIFPVVATFLKGKRGGSIWLLILVLILAAMFLAVDIGAIAVFTISYDAGTFQQLILSVSLVAGFLYFYQDSLDQKASLFQEREQQLADIYTQLQDEIRQRKIISESLKNNLDTLERKKARDVALLQSIGEGVIAVDSKGRIIMVNPTVERMFNYYESNLIGKSYSEMFRLYNETGHVIPTKHTPLLKTLATQTSEHEDTYYYHNYNGQPVPVAITSTPIVLDNQHIGAIEVFHDISEEQAIARAKDEFVSLASHQLRTPLSAIKWYTERLLRSTDLKPKERGYLETIHEDSARLTGLLSDYLNVSRLELKTAKLQLETIDPNTAIEEALNDLQPLIKEKSLKVTTKLAPKLALKSDMRLLEMVVQNLISNAVKYTPSDGEITLTSVPYSGKSEHLKGGAVISIEDSGIGIPSGEQSKLFTKLFRAKNAVTGSEEGTGLGLYTAKAAIDRLGGEIWFDSKIGKGTQFSVTIPDQDNDIMAKTSEE